jgi:tetratricopeptide (TPR) repeat protein
VLLTAALTVSCADTPNRSTLEPIPETDLGTFETNVRTQLAAAATDMETARKGKDDHLLAAAYGELGRRLHAYELLEAAAAAYRNAVTLAPDEFRWLYHLAILYQATGELEEAAQLLLQALEQRRTDLPARLRLAEIRLGQGDSTAARAVLERALEIDPACALAHFFLGNVASAERDQTGAVKHYERALELQPNATAVHSPLAVAYSALGDSERAESHLTLRGRQVVQLLDPLALELGTLHVGAVGRIRRGARAQVEGNLTLARDEYVKAVAADPENPEARQSLGSVLALLGETDSAIAEYRAALDLSGENALVLGNLGGLLVTTPEPAEGVRHLERALELDPTLENAHLALGQTRLEQGRPDLAETHYRGVLQRTPSSLAARLGLSRSLAAAGRAPTAITELQRALERDPGPEDAAAIHQELAALAAAAGDRRETLAQLSRALELQPRLTSARFARANLLGITKRYAEAAEEYSLFLAERPASVPGYMGQATALVMAGDFGAAERSLTVGLRNTDQNPDLMLTLGRLLVTAPDPAARDPQRGLELSRKALDGLGSPEAAETTALALAAVGNSSTASASAPATSRWPLGCSRG